MVRKKPEETAIRCSEAHRNGSKVIKFSIHRMHSPFNLLRHRHTDTHPLAEHGTSSLRDVRGMCLCRSIVASSVHSAHRVHCAPTDDANLYQFSNPTNLLNHFASARFQWCRYVVIISYQTPWMRAQRAHRTNRTRKKKSNCVVSERTSSTPAKIRNFSVCRSEWHKQQTRHFIINCMYVCRHCVIATHPHAHDDKYEEKFNRISIRSFLRLNWMWDGKVAVYGDIDRHRPNVVNSRRVRLCTIK